MSFDLKNAVLKINSCLTAHFKNTFLFCSSSLEKINQNHMDKNRTTYLENKLEEGYNSIKGKLIGLSILSWPRMFKFSISVNLSKLWILLILGSQEGVKIINHSEFSSNDRLEEDCFNKSNITSLNDKRVKIRALNVACLSRGKYFCLETLLLF